MIRRIAVACIALAASVAPAAMAQVGGRPFEVSGQAGFFNPDARAHVESGAAFGGSVGWRFSPFMVFEGQVLFAPSKADTAPEMDHNYAFGGADLRWNFRPAEGRVVPFALVGMAYGSSHNGGSDPARLERGAPSLGLGTLINLGNQRAYLRLQARDFMFTERNSHELGHNFAVTAGLHWIFGGRVKDQDLDGVRDWLDKCPDTPIGATVDPQGCPIDSDGDKVFDGLDSCAATPSGCVVNKVGCPVDADADGVCDGLDQCASTPAGARVDTRGCPTDADADSVFDGIDACDNTPRGCRVDAKGCPTDADGDGVCDGLDECADTPAGVKVDPKGCPVELIERETELLDTGMIRLQDVNFATGKADLLPESMPALDVVGTILTKWSELKIEVGGHTDSRGSNATNQALSQKRAQSVRNYLLQKFPTLTAEQLTAKGYGESKPVVPNSNDLNMAKNRRVEFVVTNKDVLKKETERRRLLREGEAAPAPAPQPAPADTTKR